MENQSNRLPQGSVLSPTLFNPYTNDFLATMLYTQMTSTMWSKALLWHNWNAASQQTWNEQQHTVASNHACLKRCPVYFISVILVQLKSSVSMEGQQLRHDPSPGDHPGQNNELVRTPEKGCRENSELQQPTSGSNWGADANTLRVSTLALCYSTAE